MGRERRQATTEDFERWLERSGLNINNFSERRGASVRNGNGGGLRPWLALVAAVVTALVLAFQGELFQRFLDPRYTNSERDSVRDSRGAIIRLESAVARLDKIERKLDRLLMKQGIDPATAGEN